MALSTPDRNASGNTSHNKQTEYLPPNLELQGYEIAFRQWLESTGNFHTFKQRATEELQRLGFYEWSYSRIDVPANRFGESVIGTISCKLIQQHIKNAFYKDDLIDQHILTSKSILWRSTLDNAMDSSSAETDSFIHNKSITALYKEFGYQDYTSIPVNRNSNTNHAFFILACAKGDVATFRKNVNSNLEKLTVIIKTFEAIGSKNFSDYFLGPKKAFEKLLNGKPIRLLNAMYRHDLKVYQAAESLHMSRDSADKYLKQIREYFGVSTTHGALREAIKQGLISP